MADVLSLPVSTSLLNEVNAVGDPNRKKAQDGTIGDKAHEDRVSDHNRDETGNTGSSHDSDNINEVHARDVDTRGPWKIKGGAERIVQLIVANVRSMGYTKRRVKYVISNKRIWVWRKVNGAWAFIQETYSGSDPHILHFHVSFEYGSGSGPSNPENNTSPWGILAAYKAQEDIPVEPADFNKLMNGWAGSTAGKKLLGDALLAALVGNKTTPTRDVMDVLGDLGNQLRPAFVFPRTHRENIGSGMPTDAPIWALLAMPDRLTAIEQKLSTLTGGGTLHTS